MKKGEDGKVLISPISQRVENKLDRVLLTDNELCKNFSIVTSIITVKDLNLYISPMDL